MIRFIVPVTALCILIQSCSVSDPTPTSPDGRIRVRLGINGDEPFSYSVLLGEGVLVGASPISLEFRDQPTFSGGLDVVLVSNESVDETWRPLWGKTEEARNRYNEYVYRVSERKEEARFLDWVIRVYNDGVAFRYVFPENSGFGTFHLTEERTSFQLDPSFNCWATNHQTYYSSQEHLYEKRTAGEIATDELIGCPLLAEVPGTGWLLLTEADLTDWAGLYFEADGSEPGRMVSSLAALRRDPALKVMGKTPAASPWRVIMAGDQLGTLLESDLIGNLNDPVEYEETDWIKPGISAWDRWWCGDYGPDAGFELGMNTATMKYFVDLADEMDWEYMIVDWTWYGNVFTDGEPDPKADITTPIEEVDITGIIDYAGARDVKIILWVLSNHLDQQMDEALALYEKWGAAGIKVDFMDCDDQDMVNWYHNLARKAARHRLIIDFHGAYKPTGVSRTLPNMMTREGVLGNEYSKWSDLITPRHTVTLPYTRGVLGEMDFTPGGFNHLHQQDFIVAGGDAPNPYVMGTRCHQLAMTVIYESAFMVLCDSPYNYRGAPGSDFLREVPSTWDETHFIEGYPGESIVLARRSGNSWFVGGMTSEAVRKVNLHPGFLEEGVYRATIWKDAVDSDRFPDRLEKMEITVESSDHLQIQMNIGGGFVMKLDPPAEG